MGIAMSLGLCIGISPVTTLIYLCLNKNRSKSAICIFMCTSILLTTLQFHYSDAFQFYDIIPEWLIIVTGINYALFFSSLFRYILS